MKSLKIKPELDSLHVVMDFIHNNISTDDIKLDLVVEELFVNIVNYSNANFVEIVVGNENDLKFNIEFIDDGVEFDPLKQDDPDFPESIEEAKIGGLGIFFVKNFADEVYYNNEDGKNHLTIIKKFD